MLCEAHQRAHPHGMLPKHWGYFAGAGARAGLAAGSGAGSGSVCVPNEACPVAHLPGGLLLLQAAGQVRCSTLMLCHPCACVCHSGRFSQRYAVVAVRDNSRDMHACRFVAAFVSSCARCQAHSLLSSSQMQIRGCLPHSTMLGLPASSVSGRVQVIIMHDSRGVTASYAARCARMCQCTSAILRAVCIEGQSSCRSKRLQAHTASPSTDLKAAKLAARAGCRAARRRCGRASASRRTATARPVSSSWTRSWRSAAWATRPSCPTVTISLTSCFGSVTGVTGLRGDSQLGYTLAGGYMQDGCVTPGSSAAAQCAHV